MTFHRSIKLKLCKKIDFSGNFALKTLAVSNVLEMNNMKSLLGAKPYINFKNISGKYELTTDLKIELKLFKKIDFPGNFALKSRAVSNVLEMNIMKFFLGTKLYLNLKIITCL